jgi:hypothetical protein
MSADLLIESCLQVGGSFLLLFDLLIHEFSFLFDFFEELLVLFLECLVLFKDEHHSILVAEICLVDLHLLSDAFVVVFKIGDDSLSLGDLILNNDIVLLLELLGLGLVLLGQYLILLKDNLCSLGLLGGILAHELVQSVIRSDVNNVLKSLAVLYNDLIIIEFVHLLHFLLVVQILVS